AEETSTQRAFATPEKAAAALGSALASNNQEALLDIFGHDHADLVLGGDPATSRVARRRAAAALKEKTELHKDADDQSTLMLGKQKWPMPIPLRHTERGWVFDTEAGEEEVWVRRIGADELAAIDALKALVKAQSAYVSRSGAKGGTTEYARFIQSTPGAT